MKYVVTVDGRTLPVELDGQRAIVEGAELVVDLAALDGSPIRLVTVEGVVHRLIVRRSGGRGAYELWLGGDRFTVEALDERTHAIRALTARSAAVGPMPITAPMPGLIVRVEVSVGDAVAAGQGVVVMEAMKMENELRAVSTGTVRAVHAIPGQAVEKGALLVELE